MLQDAGLCILVIFRLGLNNSTVGRSYEITPFRHPKNELPQRQVFKEAAMSPCLDDWHCLPRYCTHKAPECDL